ncbi:uncharacterized protein LOC111693538, partial [Trichogramma pretiosum]|uniref:uncharacterized protein LOC111693538 n=1 Tax=Trichogramma pretiosum TaxID=7493 RepID=UPI000C719303
MKPSFIAENKINVIINAMDNDLAFLHPTEIDCGVEYQLALQTKNINNEMRKEVQYRVFNYIKSLCQELCTRLPTNLEFYYKLSAISPKTCLSKERPAFMQLPFVKELIPRSLLGKVESQYAKLMTIDLRSKLSEEELTDSNKFWVATYNLTNASGAFPLRELSHHMLTLLSLPSSNAVVERAFSIMNLIKTKTKNRLELISLDSLLRIRLNFYSN